MGSASSLNAAETTPGVKVSKELSRKRKTIGSDWNDELPAKNQRVEDELSNAQLSSIVMEEDEAIEPAPVPNLPAQAAAASKVSVVFKAPLVSGRPKGGGVGKLGSSACRNGERQRRG